MIGNSWHVPMRIWCGGLVLVCAVAIAPAWAAVVTTKSGLQLEGQVDKISSLGETALNAVQSAGEIKVKPIVIINDELRLTFLPSSQVSAFAESPPQTPERIKLEQPVARTGRRIGGVFPLPGRTPFDAYGRRLFPMRGPKGVIAVIQGITEITPTYTKVEGLLVENSYVWDMRIATSSLDRETLSKILTQGIDQKDADARLRIVRLYIQAERFRDALIELEKIIEEFPDLAHLKEQAERLLQLLAQHALREIELRREAGQYQRVKALLSHFPQAGISGETLIKVRDLLAEDAKQDAQRERVLQFLDTHLRALKEDATRAALQVVREEIQRELSPHTMNRMADYLRLADDTTLSADQKLALAVSGWLMGSGSGAENLAVAISLWEVRDAVVKYLRAMGEHERTELLEKIRSLEGASPAYVARLLENIKPPLDVPAEPKEVPGLYQLSVPGIEKDSEFPYLVQVPPEYDPNRRYPCVLTLNGGTSELLQIDWWAGPYSGQSQMREGQASRHGYIVLAPRWQKPQQIRYEYSAREHAAVLYCLRDAQQRFSINTDRVFLSGHSLGGNAAWDIGVSHPDLWAGVIPIVGNADRYVRHYTENARNLPLYFVGGEMDGNWLQDNGMEFDRYMKRAGYDCTVVQYRGRGHEHFQDEIQRIFDWMQLASHTRNLFSRDFEAKTMRPWDDFFWWIEVDEIPARSIIYPEQWTAAGGTRAMPLSARMLETNRLSIKSGSGRVTVWLSPRLLNFDRPISVTVNSREIRDPVTPSVDVLLEDVRTRGDRQNPFWAKSEWPERRR